MKSLTTASPKSALADYEKKRDFSRSAEPSPSQPVPPPSEFPRFVIQKHDASRLHYDLRLEVDGTLKSWAVPKGIPFTKGERHLAVHTEDHPLSYFDFEGTIPQGEYGGGTVMIWDQGIFAVSGEDPAAQIEQGKLHFAMQGSKLSGEWTLVRMRDDPSQWLLIKVGADMKPVSKRNGNRSSLSGRTLRQIARAGEDAA